MKVIVDTSVWSHALRRGAPREHASVALLRELIADGQVVMLGPIRQELLSGIRSKARFDALQDRLRAFPDEPLTTRDYETAGEFFIACRQQGIQGSNTDLLICAAAVNRGFLVFTTDHDFQMFKRAIDFEILTP